MGYTSDGTLRSPTMSELTPLRVLAGQIPFLIIAFVLTFLKVRYTVPGQGKSKREMLQRIDYSGSVTLIGAVSLSPPSQGPEKAHLSLYSSARYYSHSATRTTRV